MRKSLFWLHFWSPMAFWLTSPSRRFCASVTSYSRRPTSQHVPSRLTGGQLTLSISSCWQKMKKNFPGQCKKPAGYPPTHRRWLIGCAWYLPCSLIAHTAPLLLVPTTFSGASRTLGFRFQLVVVRVT